jgi:serine/threonine-protein kinase
MPADLQVVLRCLVKERAQRFPDAQSLDRSLAACQRHGCWGREQAAAWWQEGDAGLAGRSGAPQK